jgi:hypothetical protein
MASILWADMVSAIVKLTGSRGSSAPQAYNRLRDTADDDAEDLLPEQGILSNQDQDQDLLWLNKYIPAFRMVKDNHAPIPVLDRRVDGPYHFALGEGIFAMNAAAHYYVADRLYSIIEAGITGANGNQGMIPLYRNVLDPPGRALHQSHLKDWDVFKSMDLNSLEVVVQQLLAHPRSTHIVAHGESALVKWIRERLIGTISQDRLDQIPIIVFSQAYQLLPVPAPIVHFLCSSSPSDQSILKETWIRVPLFTFVAWYYDGLMKRSAVKSGLAKERESLSDLKL